MSAGQMGAQGQYMTCNHTLTSLGNKLGQTGETSQMPMTNKMQHLASKYHVELNPAN